MRGIAPLARSHRSPLCFNLIANPRRARGFTLLEILVVVVILGVLAGAVTLAIGAVGGERQLARQAEQVRALISYACEQAERGGHDLGVSIDSAGFRFSIADRGDWIASDAVELRARKWLAGLTPTLSRDGQPVAVTDKTPEKPQLVCFSSGELTPFRLQLALADLAKQYRIDGQPDGDVELSTVDTRAR
jgi:general secretion pathway protein H